MQARMLVSGIGWSNGGGKRKMDLRCVMEVDLTGFPYGLGMVDGGPNLNQWLSPKFLPQET